MSLTPTHTFLSIKYVSLTFTGWSITANMCTVQPYSVQQNSEHNLEKYTGFWPLEHIKSHVGSLPPTEVGTVLETKSQSPGVICE